jgi:hypothetical protein
LVVVVVVEGTVVLVVLVVVVVPPGLVVVVVVDGTVVVEAGVVVDVVVVVEAGGGEGLMTLFNDVPVPPWPKIEDSGLPAMSSTAVTNRSASTNTMAAVPAMVFQVNRPSGPPRPAPAPAPVRGLAPVPSPVPAATLGTGAVLACNRSVAGASVTAETSSRRVASAAAAVAPIRAVSAAA